MLARAIVVSVLCVSLASSANLARRAAPDHSKDAPAVNILFFTASWCEPCRAVHPILEKFARKNKKNVKLTTIDFDRAKPEAARWDVQEVPVVIVLSAEGKVLLRYEGASRDSLASLGSALEDCIKGLRKGGEK
jgi:thioredoxin-like negative regulator of GroEL